MAVICMTQSAAYAEVIEDNAYQEAEVNVSLQPVESGYEQSFELSYVSNFGNTSSINNSSAFELVYIGGYRNDDRFFVGLGTGIYIPTNITSAPYFISEEELENGLPDRGLNIPLFLHTKIYFTQTRCQPFFALSVGPRLSFDNTFTPIYVSGYYDENNNWHEVIEYGDEYIYNTCYVFVNPSIGVNVRVSNRVGIYAQVGLYAQNAIQTVSENIKEETADVYPFKYKPYASLKYPFECELRASLGVTF